MNIVACSIAGQMGARDTTCFVGGGDVGFRLAQHLDGVKGMRLRVVERSHARGEFIAARLRNGLVLNGDGTDLALLEAEEIGRSDVMVSVIDNDESNLFASLLGRQLGVGKIITRVGKQANLRVFERVGIDVALSARGAAVASVIHKIDGGRASLLAVLMAAGMPFFEAMCHSMTTLAAGGFSPHELSIMGYQSPAIEWIICLFMFLAGANFALQYRALLGRPGALLGDEEFRTYAGIVFAGAVVLGVALWSSGASDPLRSALFQTLSVLTTTGYASVDFDLWNGQAKVVLLVLMFIGGCAGSAAGGPKVLRHLLIGRYTLLELRRTLHPRGVLVFFLFYVLVFAVTAACVIGLGADIVTGLTASAATLGNIGPGLGGVGPLASYGDLHPLSKVLLTATMWIGRLEVVAVLALLRWEVWRLAHWRG